MSGRTASKTTGYVVGMLAVVAVMAAAVVLFATENESVFGPLVTRAQDAYRAKDWKEASRLSSLALSKTPYAIGPKRLLARCLTRQKRDAEGLKAYEGIPVDRLEGEDFLLISGALIRTGKPLLGWMSLDAATKLDFKDRETAVARVALDSARSELGINERQSDLLTTPANGLALGQLVIGLVRVERPTAGPKAFQPMLDRLLERDRPTLSEIKSPADAQRLIARMLLEDGRPAEARDWLRGRDDAESQWLASRASLDLGDHAAAEGELENAGRYSKQHIMDYEPCQYVGAKACAKCHGQIYKDQQSSRHSKTLVRADALDTVPLPKAPVKDPFNPDVVHEFDRKGKTIEVRTKVGGETFRAVVNYALGSARHGQTLMAREPSGRYRTLRISYYTGGDYWDITSGFEPHPKPNERYLGEGSSAENYRNCIDCHSTRFRSDDDPLGPEGQDHGIGCEKCHGPGENHLKSVEGGFAELAIARPKQATPAERMRLCARCHSADGSIPQSDIKFVRFQSTTLTFSRCFTESAGKLDCVVCHDPHKNAVTKDTFYESRCLACHSRTKPEAKLHFESVAGPPCKLNKQSGCVTCHMPKVENMLPFTAFTDHHIRVVRSPNQTAQPPD